MTNRWQLFTPSELQILQEDLSAGSSVDTRKIAKDKKRQKMLEEIKENRRKYNR